jgi:hypothetical protein
MIFLPVWIIAFRLRWRYWYLGMVTRFGYRLFFSIGPLQIDWKRKWGKL